MNAIKKYNFALLINEQKVMTGRYRYRRDFRGYFKNLFKR